MVSKRQGFENGNNGDALTSATRVALLTDGQPLDQIDITGSPVSEISTVKSIYGTRAWHFQGGSGTSVRGRWTSFSTTTVSGWTTFLYDTYPGSGGGFLSVLNAGGTTLASMSFDASRRLITKDSTPTTWATGTYAFVAGTKYRYDYQFFSGSAASAPYNGYIKWWLHLASDANLGAAGTVLDSGVFTAANLGVSQVIAQTRLPGKFDSTTTCDGYLDESRQLDGSTFPALPTANIGPLFSSQSPKQRINVGSTATITATATDADGNVASWGAWTCGLKPAGAATPTFTPGSGMPSGVGTTSSTYTVTTSALTVPGRYEFSPHPVDNLGAVPTADPVIVVIVTRLIPNALSTTGDNTAEGGGTVLANISDNNNATSSRTPDLSGTTSDQKWNYEPAQDSVAYTVSYTLSCPQATPDLYCTVSLMMGATVIASKTETGVDTSLFSGHFDLTSGELAAWTDRDNPVIDVFWQPAF